MDSKQTLAYWIVEREHVRQAKEAGLPKPWSDDSVFQQTYFCNVRREDDRVTRWIRSNWNPGKLGWDDYEYAMVVARFLNWPDTLKVLQWHAEKGEGLPSPSHTLELLTDLAANGNKVWGNAYVVTTHGIPMGKARYLCQRVLPAAYDLLGAGRWRRVYGRGAPLLKHRHEDYMRLEGMGSFMSAQVLADLKNTKDHPLYEAVDWSEWSAPGPGSLRGLEWYHGKKISVGGYENAIKQVADELPMEAAALLMHQDHNGINMQDLQNCLCEYDKYMRVKNGTGRSKRGYSGK